MDDLQKAINTLVDKHLNSVLSIPVQLATVSSVDKDKCSCEVKLSNGVEIKEVNLRSILDNNKKGFVVFPKVNTMVLIGTIENNENNAFVLMCSEITDFTIDAKIVMNDGDNDGIPKVKAVTDELNSIKDDINKLKQVFSSWAVAPQDGGAALKSAATTWAGQQLTQTNKNDLENKDVKH